MKDATKAEYIIPKFWVGLDDMEIQRKLLIRLIAKLETQTHIPGVKSYIKAVKAIQKLHNYVRSFDKEMFDLPIKMNLVSLRKNKHSLLLMTDKFKNNGRHPSQHEHIEGILCMIDAIQDHAIDVEGYYKYDVLHLMNENGTRRLTAPEYSE